MKGIFPSELVFVKEIFFTLKTRAPSLEPHIVPQAMLWAILKHRSRVAPEHNFAVVLKPKT